MLSLGCCSACLQPRTLLAGLVWPAAATCGPMLVCDLKASVGLVDYAVICWSRVQQARVQQTRPMPSVGVRHLCATATARHLSMMLCTRAAAVCGLFLSCTGARLEHCGCKYQHTWMFVPVQPLNHTFDVKELDVKKLP